jgi:creatinine amidohydrolase
MGVWDFTRRGFLGRLGGAAVAALARSAPGVGAASTQPQATSDKSERGQDMPVLRYEELLPVQFDEAIRKLPVCYVPIGSIEWHGEHLPLGVDSFRAILILERACEKFGGIVYPPIYSGIAGETGWDPARYAYNGNVMIPEEVFRKLIEAIVVRLKKAGFKGIILLTGHHPREQPAVLRQIAKDLSDDTCRIWGDADPALGALYRGDHAGYGETSFMLHGRAKLVQMDLLKKRGDYGVSKDRGPDGQPGPAAAYRATAADGQKMVESAAEKIGELLKGWKLIP